MNRICIAVMSVLVLLGGAAPVLADDQVAQPTELKLAQAAKKKKAATQERYMIREGRMKGKDSTKINMEEADISGAPKTPMGTLINQNKADKNYDFVKIRLNWHQEMIQSASSLESGRNK